MEKSIKQSLNIAELEDLLNEKMPLLGHRNWIVITDMAYPLQSDKGITTLYINAPYTKILSTVKKSIDNAPHVFAHVYRDTELEYITENEVPGIKALVCEMNTITGSETKSILHEKLIHKLDEASKLFHILIIKTNLTMPYTSTFFELDCKYWDANRQEKLEKAMNK